jgi:chaperonin cofactor prefoldin
MAFFENLSKKVGSVAESAADKASEFAETTKLNSSISSEKKQIEALFIEIGKQIFEKEKDNPDSPLAELIGKIVSSQNTIAELQSKIDRIKGGND